MTPSGSVPRRKFPFKGVTADDSKIEVREAEGYRGVFALEDIAANSVIINLGGVISERPTKYSIQLDEDNHLGPPTGARTGTESVPPWTFLNHSCEPNGYVNCADRTFRALRDIRAGEELTFNYLTTEREMASPFECRCGSVKCFGLIRGYKYLAAEQRESLRHDRATASLKP